MSELLNVFEKLSEFYPRTLRTWEAVETVYAKEEEYRANPSKADDEPPAKITRKRSRSMSTDSSGIENDPPDEEKVQRSPLERIPLVIDAKTDSIIMSALLEVAATIRSIRETDTSYDNTFDSWDQVIEVSPKDGFLALIYTLVGLGSHDPGCRMYRQLSIAASSAYVLSLTIPGAKGFHIFEDEVILAALQVFTLVEKIQSPAVANSLSQQHSVETWVNFTSFCDDLKLMFRYVHFDGYKPVRDAIVRRLIDMQYLTNEIGFVNMYAASLHGKYFEILEEVVNVHHGDPKETLLLILKMTLFLHIHSSRPKGGGSTANSQSNQCEHISDWFIKIIGKYPRITQEVLDFYIQCVITNPDKSWRPEHTQRALDYAAKYDAALFTRCNASVVEYLSKAVYAEEVGIRSRSVDLLAKIALIESNVDWHMFRHEVSEIPREVYIINELIDSFCDTNNNINLKAVQAIHQALTRGSPNSKKILTEGIKYAQFNDIGVKLPEEPRVLKNEIRFCKPVAPEPAYTFMGVEIVALSFLHMPEHVYALFSNPLLHVRRAAVMLIEAMVKINPLIIYNTNFVRETCNLVSENTILVRKQTLIMVDSILATYPNCYPVIFVWCKIIAPMMQDSDPKNIELAMECFKNRVLLNIRGIDQTNEAEHFMPWVIIRTLLVTQSRLYLQTSFHLGLKKHMLNQQIISTVESHIRASNLTEAWILLNFICGKIKSKEPDSLIHCFVSYHSSFEWNNEHNLLIALEVLNTCVSDFSFSALNNVFEHLIKFIESGTIIPQVIGKAFDFLTTIADHSDENQLESEPCTSSQEVKAKPKKKQKKWVTDLHALLEGKILEEMPHFPENRSKYLSFLFSYSEVNLHVRIRPHKTIVSFILRYINACIEIPESEFEQDNDRLFNSMIIIAGRFSIRDENIASATCELYGRILQAIDRPMIVNTILVAVTDLSKKHTQIVEYILPEILSKLSSSFLMNRLITFGSFTAMVMEDQLKLRGSLLLGLLTVMLDESKELSERATEFFAEVVKKKNPYLFHKCLVECPFVLNEYQNYEGLDSFTNDMIKSPLKGNAKQKKRHKLYDHFMESIEDVNLILYFGNLKLLAEKSYNDPQIKSPEGSALITDIFYILTQVCKRKSKDVEKPQQESENDEGDTGNDTTTAQAKTSDQSAKPNTPGQSKGQRGKRHNIPTMADALALLEKSLVFIVSIAKNTTNHADSSVQRSIDDLARALSVRFPNLIEFAQPSEFWSKYRHGKVTSTPHKNRRFNPIEILSDITIYSPVGSEKDGDEGRENNKGDENTKMETNDRESGSDKCDQTKTNENSEQVRDNAESEKDTRSESIDEKRSKSGKHKQDDEHANKLNDKDGQQSEEVKQGEGHGECGKYDKDEDEYDAVPELKRLKLSSEILEYILIP